MGGKIIFVSLICAVFAKPQGLGGLNPVFINPSSSSDDSKPLGSSSDDVSITPFSDGNRTSSDHVLLLTNFKPAATASSNFPTVQQIRNNQPAGIVPHGETSSNSSSFFLNQPFKASPEIPTPIFRSDTEESPFHIIHARQIQGSAPVFPTSSNSSTFVRQPINQNKPINNISVNDKPINTRIVRQVQGSFPSFNPASANRSSEFSPVRHPVNPTIQNHRQVQDSFTSTSNSANPSNVFNPSRQPQTQNQNQLNQQASSQIVRNARQTQGSFAPTSIKTEGNLNKDSFVVTSANRSTLISPVRHPQNPLIQRQLIHPVREIRQAQGSFVPFTPTNTAGNSPFESSANRSTFSVGGQTAGEQSQLNFRNARQAQGSFAPFNPSNTEENANRDSVFVNPSNRSTLHSIVRQPLNPNFQSGSADSQLILRRIRQVDSSAPDFNAFSQGEDSEEEDEEIHVDSGDQDQFPQSFDLSPDNQSFQPQSEESDSGVDAFPNSQDFSSQGSFPIFQNPSSSDIDENIEKRQISFPSDIASARNSSKPTSTFFN